MVQAIHPTGEINPNECLYCLHCQVVYHDEHRCPPMVQKRKRRERLQDLQSKSAAVVKASCSATEIPDFIGEDKNNPGPSAKARGKGASPGKGTPG